MEFEHLLKKMPGVVHGFLSKCSNFLAGAVEWELSVGKGLWRLGEAWGDLLIFKSSHRRED